METVFGGDTQSFDLMARFAEKLLEHPVGSLDYQLMTDGLLNLTGAVFVAFSTYHKNKTKVSLNSFSIANDGGVNAEKVPDFSLLNKTWEVNPAGMMMLHKGGIIRHSSLSAAVSEVLPDETAKRLEAAFRLGETVFIGVPHGKDLIGEFFVIMPRGRRLTYDSIIKLYVRQVGISIMRNKAERALQASEERNRLLVENTNEAIFLVSGEKVVYFNPKALAIFNYSADELMSKPFWELIHIDDQDTVAEKLCNSTGQIPDKRFYARAVTKNRDIKWVEFYGVRITWKQEPALLVFSNDITERKLAEDRLLESEEKYRSLIDQSVDMLYLHDLNGKILDVNKAVIEQSGYSKEELLNLTMFDINTHIKASEVTGLWQNWPAKKVYAFRLTHRKCDGSYYPVEVRTGKISYGGRDSILALVRDITEQEIAAEKLRAYQNQLQEKQQLLQSILDNAPINIWLVDLEKKPLLVNKQMENNTGNWSAMSQEELALFTGSDREVLAMDAPLYSEEIFTFADGKEHILQTIKTKLLKEDGSVLGILGLGLDITDRKQAEAELERLSLHDILTGTYNRAFFEKEIRRIEENKIYPTTIVTVDIDGLKIINDTLGHYAGDGLLKESAEIIKNSLRSSDIFCRIGGDEFAVIMPETDEKTAESIINTILFNLDRYNKSNPKLPVSISVGWDTAYVSGKLLNDAYMNADDAMYRSKLIKAGNIKSHIVTTLLSALGERDYITEGHAERLNELGIRLGKTVGLSSEQTDNLTLLTQVHDLGKVGIPDRILYKAGTFNKEEWAIMRKHSEIGYRIALSSPELSGIADLILKHHEKWDGSGYPLGLSGRGIPIECRILAIIDAYDAMTNARPYSTVKSRAEALAEIRKCSGTQFDPELVDIFMSFMEGEDN